MLSILFATNVSAIENDSLYCLIYVAFDKESDQNAIADRVNQLTGEFQKSGGKYLLYISRGLNPIVTTKPEEADSKINEIFRPGAQSNTFPDEILLMLHQFDLNNDFATLDDDLKTIYLVNKIRFHFIISKSFIKNNYLRKFIGNLLTCCRMNKVTSQECDFYATIYFGKEMSAKGLLEEKNPLNPLGSEFPFNYTFNKFLKDDK